MKRVHGWAFPDADDFMAHEMTPEGDYQAGHLTAALAHVTDWSCAIDGGAHVGTWTRPLSQRFARVIAVEPSPDTYEALEANIRRLALPNVELLNRALGAHPGFVSMTMDPRHVAVRNTGARYIQPGGTIPCDAIDDWQLPSLGFLKLDVEGSEALAIEGAALTLTRCRPIVLFENKGFWRRFGQPKDAPHQVLTSLGYRALERAGTDVIWGPA